MFKRLVLKLRVPECDPQSYTVVSHRERREVGFDSYDREDPCIRMSEILTGLSKWSDRYLSSCSCERNSGQQKKRMEKWSTRLNQGKG